MVPCAGRVFEELHAFFVSAFISLGAKLGRLGGRLGHSTLTNSVNLFILGQHRNEHRC